jgi:DNA-binding transcriptional MocR family regulator
MAPAAQAQDFIKGWPHPELLQTEQLKTALLSSFKRGLDKSHQYLNYGDKENGAYMLGHPDFRKALAGFLEKQYNLPVEAKSLMSTAGASMGTDMACRVHCKPGDIAIVEEPTYYLAHAMIKDRGMSLLGVPIEEDGMDIDAVERLLEKHSGKIKMVYTVPVHHNPTGYTMSDAKRKRLVALARKHNFVICADEAYQLLNFEPSTVKPMFYYDDPADPKVLSVSTFSKLIGPGTKVGWVQAHEVLLKPLASLGFVDSGNNPVIFSSCNLIDFLESGGMATHLEHVSKDLGVRCALICKRLREVGLEVWQPKGGYFVWVRSKGKMTGRSGECMAVNKDKFHDWMRLCFCWLTVAQLEEGIEYLRQ